MKIKKTKKAKRIFIALSVFCAVVPFIIYSIMGLKIISRDANCISYFELAANANSVEIAEKHLSTGINYLEEHNLTEGNTKILFYRPTNDLGLWYENLKSAQIQLRELVEKEELTELEESNALMKLRETLLDPNGTVTCPSMISFYPNHIVWFLTACLIWTMWFLAIWFSVYAINC